MSSFGDYIALNNIRVDMCKFTCILISVHLKTHPIAGRIEDLNLKFSQLAYIPTHSISLTYWRSL